VGIVGIHHEGGDEVGGIASPGAGDVGEGGIESEDGQIDVCRVFADGVVEIELEETAVAADDLGPLINVRFATDSAVVLGAAHDLCRIGGMEGDVVVLGDGKCGVGVDPGGAAVVALPDAAVVADPEGAGRAECDGVLVGMKLAAEGIDGDVGPTISGVGALDDTGDGVGGKDAAGVECVFDWWDRRR